MNARTVVPGESRWRSWQLIGLLFSFALLVRLIGIDHDPLWADELFSVFWARQDIAFLLGPGRRIETNPPAFYLLLHRWMDVAGSSELALRMPSALASAATAPLVFVLGKRLLDEKRGLLAGILFALSPMAFYHAQQARAYSLLLLLNVLGLIALARHLEERTSSQPNGIRAAPLLLFGAVAALCVNLHFSGIFFAVAGLGLILLLWLVEKVEHKPEVALWQATLVLVVAGSLPSLLDAASLTSSANMAWIAPFGVKTVRTFIVDLIAGPSPSGAMSWKLALTAASVPACIALCVAALRPRLLPRPALLLLVALPVAFLAMLASLSVVRQLFISRYGLWLVVPLVLLVSHGLLSIRSPVGRSAALAGVLLASFVGAFGQIAVASEEDWRRLARTLETDPRCTGPLVFDQRSAPLGVVYYAPALARRPMHLLEYEPAEPLTAEGWLGVSVLQPSRITRRDLDELLHRGEPLTVIARGEPARQQHSHLTSSARVVIGEGKWLVAWCL